MNIGVLASGDDWHWRDLCRAARGLHRLVRLSYTDLSGRFVEQQVTEFTTLNVQREVFRLSTLDALIVRAMPTGSLEQVVLRMDVLQQVVAQGCSAVINPPRTIEASVDKYLCLEKIRAVGIPVPATFVTESVDRAIELFHQWGGDLVVKPLFGSGGRGIERLTDSFRAVARFRRIADEGGVIYCQRFVEHGDNDLRLLVVDDHVMGMRRWHPGEWITNLRQGAQPRPHRPSHRECEIARTAARALDASWAGVDLLYDAFGQPFVVEVNACPGWKGISQVVDQDIARLMLEAVARKGNG